MRTLTPLPFLLYLSSFMAKPALAADLPLPTATVQRSTFPIEYRFDGTVEAVHQSTVSAQTAGRVQDILVDVNDTVQQGAPIVRVRNVEQRAGLEQAQATLNEAQVRVTEAQAEYQRVRNLYERQLVAKAQLDAVSATLEATKARLEAAQAGLTQAKESLGYTIVTAPYSGIVTERHVQLGETVQPGKPLMTGFSLDELRVTVDIPQRLVAAIRKRPEASVLPLSGAAPIVVEKVTIFPYADPQSNAFKARLILPKKTPGFSPGMFVKAVFQVGERTALAIPQQAIVQRGEVSAVYVVQGGNPQLRQVRRGLVHDNLVDILAGLDAGETIALDPTAATQWIDKARHLSGAP